MIITIREARQMADWVTKYGCPICRQKSYKFMDIRMYDPTMPWLLIFEVTHETAIIEGADEQDHVVRLPCRCSTLVHQDRVDAYKSVVQMMESLRDGNLGATI